MAQLRPITITHTPWVPACHKRDVQQLYFWMHRGGATRGYHRTATAGESERKHHPEIPLLHRLRSRPPPPHTPDKRHRWTPRRWPTPFPPGTGRTRSTRPRSSTPRANRTRRRRPRGRWQRWHRPCRRGKDCTLSPRHRGCSIPGGIPSRRWPVRTGRRCRPRNSSSTPAWSPPVGRCRRGRGCTPTRGLRSRTRTGTASTPALPSGCRCLRTKVRVVVGVVT